MAKNKNTNVNSTESVTVVRSHKRANIAVAIVVGITALILIAIAVLWTVRVDPMDGLKAPVRYEFYDLDSNEPTYSSPEQQNKIRSALGDMDFNIMAAITQWNWDYSYNFIRNSAGNKIEMRASEIEAVRATSSAYMIEYIYTPVMINDGEIDYSTAQSLEVDGETIYFDRVKVLISDTEGEIGEIYMYPYIYERVYNKTSGNDILHEQYRTTAVKVRANTTDAYKTLGDLALRLKHS